MSPKSGIGSEHNPMVGVMEDQEEVKRRMRKVLDARVAKAMGTGVTRDGNIFYIVDIVRAYEKYLKRPLRGVRDDHK